MRARPIGALVAVLVLATGCGAAGVADRPAAQILRDAQAAAEAADSVHISGTVARSGTTASVDIVLTSSGDGREQISAADGTRIAVVRVGPDVWVQAAGSPSFKRLAATDPQAAPLVAQLDKKTVFAQLTKAGDTPTVTGTAAVDGHPAVQLTPGSGTGVLSVADDADHPYPLKVESSTGAGPAGSLTFTDWDAHTVITPPGS